MKISGNTKLSTGQYDDLIINGNAVLNGKITCTSLSLSGQLKGQDLSCKEYVNAMGNCHFSKSISAEKITSLGNLVCDENIFANEKLLVKGTIICRGQIKSKEVDIKFEGKNKISKILSDKTTINIKKSKKFLKKIPLISKIVKNANVNYIESEFINIEYVTCPFVKGRIVVVGNGCKIDKVEYVDQIVVSKKAKITTTEKI